MYWLMEPLNILISNDDGVFAEGIKAWGCSGTPADCVKLALSE